MVPQFRDKADGTQGVSKKNTCAKTFGLHCCIVALKQQSRAIITGQATLSFYILLFLLHRHKWAVYIL